MKTKSSISIQVRVPAKGRIKHLASWIAGLEGNFSLGYYSQLKLNLEKT